MSTEAAGTPPDPADPREPYGRLVHDTRLAHEADQAAAEGRKRFNLGAWEERAPSQRELDMRIGSAIAARAVADAKVESSRRDAQLVVFRVHRGVIFDALRIAVASAGYEAVKKPFRGALEALGGKEEES